MATTSLEGRTTCPFLLKLFYRTGAFHRPDEFASHRLPSFLPVYTFPTCTLDELAHHLATAEPAVLPSPAIGTRVAFRLVFADTRAVVESGNDRGGGPDRGPAVPTRFVVKDLGSIVIGGGSGESGPDASSLEDKDTSDGRKTLADARFVVGDYISCAVLPPLLDGRIAPASQARSGRGVGIGRGRAARMPGGGERGRGGGGGGGRRDDFRRPKRGAWAGGDFGVPSGEWRRGEEVPTGPSWGRGGRQRNGRW